jgi:hypothetical protein
MQQENDIISYESTNNILHLNQQQQQHLKQHLTYSLTLATLFLSQLYNTQFIKRLVIIHRRSAERENIFLEFINDQKYFITLFLLFSHSQMLKC